ncbi:unnamed protein product [Nesidiocoris tenuis]|uniref:SWI/SNF-like complex subunit BAF250 C-terminal domain-containing protein n=1 Tax=Nesidiocoris tenuis TaxID=355587 RepID=A0A6H5H493_9HEMI|nr:unnamed protein product [Nesidiocoris tenuis]
MICDLIGLNFSAGWSNNNNAGYRGQFPGSGSPGPQQWGVQGPSRPGAPPNIPANNSQWGPQPPYPPNQSQQGWGMATPGVGQSSPLRPPLGGPRPTFRPDAKQPYPPHTGIAPHPSQLKGPGMVSYGQPGSQNQTKRELVFPVDSVEATTPVLYKRRRLTKSDVAPVDAWRIMMALKSGLLAETCWALDVLNILLFDDSTVAYFGLLHLPGLMDILLEHMKKALADMLEPSPTISPFNEEVKEVSPVDLGAVGAVPDPNDRITPLKAGDYTLKSRKGLPVTYSTESEEDIFVTSGKRPWDSEDAVEDAVEQDWSKYIISCFRAEFGNIPFSKKLDGRLSSEEKTIKEETEDSSSAAVDKPAATSSSVVPPCDDKKPETGSSSCPSSRNKKKVKSLSDVLSRIKKEPAEETERLETRPSTKEEATAPVAPEPAAASTSPTRSVTPVLSSPVKDEPPSTVKSEPEAENDTVNEDSENSETPPAEPECKIGVFNIRDPAGTLKRRRIEDYEDECYTRDEASLYLVSETQDYVARRCICLSAILRNLTFVPGNELEFAKNGTFLGLVGKLLLLHHEHPPRIPKQRKYDRDEEQDFGDCCSSLQGDGEWWWEFLHHLRENALVSIANIAGHVDLGLYPEEISRPILDGLLHWAVCPAAQGQDPFPTVGPSSALSPQRLALEALCKLCVTDSNVDLVIATPPYCRLERLAAVLTRLLCRSEEQVLREFAVNLLYYLGAADSVMARTIAMQNPCVSQLVGFIEQAEQSALGVANQHGLTALRDNPDCMGTSLDMLRRAARTLLNLAGHPDNWPLFLQQEQRLLTLVMSQILDHQVASIIAMVLYQVSRASSSVT